MSSVLFQQAFDEFPHFLALLDPDGRIRATNAAAERACRHPRAALVGRRISATPLWEAFGDAHPVVQALLAQAADGSPAGAEVPMALHDGPPRWMAFSATPLRDPRGAVTCLLLEGRDETARHEAEVARCEEAVTTSLARMAARVAHQVNNPLAGIQNAFLLVRDAIPANHPHARFVEAIDREIARIAGIMRQMVETYRGEQLPRSEEPASMTPRGGGIP